MRRAAAVLLREITCQRPDRPPNGFAVVVVVELPLLLCTVVGRKLANPLQESYDIRGIRLDKFPVRQERLPKVLPDALQTVVYVAQKRLVYH